MNAPIDISTAVLQTERLTLRNGLRHGGKLGGEHPLPLVIRDRKKTSPETR